MKKYLFDEILINSNGTICFKSFRDITFKEIFTTNKCGHAESDESYSQRDRWIFMPKNFKQFLNCLAMTKPIDGEYSINCDYPYEDLSFDDTLNLFAKRVYEAKKASKEEIVKFYKKAKEIESMSIKERNILEQKPTELIK